MVGHQGMWVEMGEVLGGMEVLRALKYFGCAYCELRKGQKSLVTVVSGFFPRSDLRWV